MKTENKAFQIRSAQVIFGRLDGWKLAQAALDYYFAAFPNNDDEKIVLVKVCLIDHLYGTNTKNPVGVAKHIVKCRVDDLLQKTNDTEAALEAITKIMKWDKKILSFASKYCHFHNKEMFPIYDKYASVALSMLVTDKIWSKNCRDYSKYRETIREVFPGFSFKEADVYLWLYGLREALRSGRKDVNREVSRLYNAEPKLFEALG